MKGMISVIVPIYMVEKYLSTCLDSIIRQTYQNLEIILVNDGSIDRCPEICEEYAKKDKRIKVIHQENCGLSGARNTGIQNANGEYICFVDSDDFIHPRMYEVLFDNLNKMDADISICGYLNVYENQRTNELTDYSNLDNVTESVLAFNNREALGHLYSDLNYVTLGVWNKLYKKELFEGIRFRVGKIHEDDFIMHRLLHKSNKVVYTNLQMYFYLQRDASITGQKFNIKRLDRLDALEERIIYFKEQVYEELFEKAYEHYLHELFTNYYLVRKFCSEKRSVYQGIRKKLNDFYQNRGTLELSTNKKIKYTLFQLSPYLSKAIETLWVRIKMVKQMEIQ